MTNTLSTAASYPNWGQSPDHFQAALNLSVHLQSSPIASAVHEIFNKEPSISIGSIIKAFLYDENPSHSRATFHRILPYEGREVDVIHALQKPLLQLLEQESLSYYDIIDYQRLLGLEDPIAVLKICAEGHSKLTNLNLPCSGINDAELAQILAAYPELNMGSFRIDQSRELSRGLSADSSGSLGITSLDLSGCGNLTDAGLAEVAKCSKLTSLNLASCYNITDFGLNQIVAGCPDLTNLNISSCDKLTAEALRRIATLHRLISLDLSSCDSIIAQGLGPLKACVGLTSLKLTSCSTFKDQNLRKLFRACPSLSDLNLSDTSITDYGLHGVTILPKLKSLDLSYCRNFTSKGLEQISQQCPSLETIHLSGCEQIPANPLFNVKPGGLRLLGLPTANLGFGY